MQCSSSELVNGLLNAVAETVEEKDGLHKFHVRDFWEENKLETGPISGFVSKATKCQIIIIDNLSFTTAENRALLLKTVGQMCAVTQCLQKLKLKHTNTTAEEGEAFLTSIADGNLATLKHLDLSLQENWFNGSRRH